MFVVDTNVLLHAVNPAAPDHAGCRARAEEWHAGAEAWFLTWGIAYEFLRVATHARAFPRPLAVTDAGAFLAALLASPGLRMLGATDRHSQIGANVSAELPRLRGNILLDAHTAILMREHGVHTIYTFDQDFHRFPFIEILDPLD